MTLVDTSVWVQHLRMGSARLAALLRDDQVLSHRFVVGELACGNLRNREEILTLLGALPEARMAEHREVLHLVESVRLYGRGLGWLDAHLLASALITRCALWTLDEPLQRAAATLRIQV
ncbi:MAG TPA: PIN domain-containing protein [Candidatus Methylomirabilis sp.]|nr:PIN domain-containing protein [Candidatus Methylomirabilis sp.]